MKRRFRTFLNSTVVVLQLVNSVYAQTAPNFSYKQVPTPAQWNGYFSGKVDYPGIFGYNNSWSGIQTFQQPVNFGAVGSFSGLINFYGVTSGIVSLTVPAVVGNPTWTLPNSPGIQGANLISTGASNPLSWTTNPNWDLVNGVQGINFNSIGDSSISISSPTPNFVIGAVWIVNTGIATNVSGGSYSLCSQALSGGTCVFTSASLGATNTGSNRLGSVAISVSNGTYTNITTWFFRITTTVGSPAAGDVLLDIRPFPIGLP